MVADPQTVKTMGTKPIRDPGSVAFVASVADPQAKQTLKSM
jgi:hypothetical protein